MRSDQLRAQTNLQRENLTKQKYIFEILYVCIYMPTQSHDLNSIGTRYGGESEDRTPNTSEPQLHPRRREMVIHERGVLPFYLLNWKFFVIGCRQTLSSSFGFVVNSFCSTQYLFFSNRFSDFSP